MNPDIVAIFFTKAVLVDIIDYVKECLASLKFRCEIFGVDIVPPEMWVFEAFRGGIAQQAGDVVADKGCAQISISPAGIDDRWREREDAPLNLIGCTVYQSPSSIDVQTRINPVDYRRHPELQGQGACAGVNRSAVKSYLPGLNGGNGTAVSVSDLGDDSEITLAWPSFSTSSMRATEW